jgi:hypothetical protein
MTAIKAILARSRDFERFLTELRQHVSVPSVFMVFAHTLEVMQLQIQIVTASNG